MKKLICLFLLFVMLFVSGCSGSGRSDGTRLTLAAADGTEAGDTDGTFDGTAGSDDEAVCDTIFVYICGCVNAPGVYELPSGSRLFELLDRCGGCSGDAAGNVLNPAASLSDGEKIYVPSEDEVRSDVYDPAVATGQAGIPGQADDDRININTADVSALQTIKGIGESRAADIVAYREANGPFRSTEDIMKVSGIKEGLYSKIKDQIRI